MIEQVTVFEAGPFPSDLMINLYQHVWVDAQYQSASEVVSGLHMDGHVKCFNKVKFK